jgi:hypothetical protein
MAWWCDGAIAYHPKLAVGFPSERCRYSHKIYQRTPVKAKYTGVCFIFKFSGREREKQRDPFERLMQNFHFTFNSIKIICICVISLSQFSI